MCVYSWFLTLHAFSACLKKEKKKKKEERVVLRMGCSGNKTNRVTWYIFRFRFSFHYPWLGGVLAGPESLTHSLPPIKYYPSPTTLHLLPRPRDHRKNNPSAEISFPFAYIFFFLRLALSRPDRLHAFLRLGLSKIGT